MNAAIRCDERDQAGHRCNQKRGHVKHGIAHQAFGKVWGDPSAKRIRKAKGARK